jgi:hypothetical protein
MWGNIHKDQKRILTLPAVFGIGNVNIKEGKNYHLISQTHSILSPFKNKMWNVKVSYVRFVIRILNDLYSLPNILRVVKSRRKDIHKEMLPIWAVFLCCIHIFCRQKTHNATLFYRLTCIQGLRRLITAATSVQ